MSFVVSNYHRALDESKKYFDYLLKQDTVIPTFEKKKKESKTIESLSKAIAPSGRLYPPPEVNSLGKVIPGFNMDKLDKNIFIFLNMVSFNWPSFISDMLFVHFSEEHCLYLSIFYIGQEWKIVHVDEDYVVDKDKGTCCNYCQSEWYPYVWWPSIFHKMVIKAICDYHVEIDNVIDIFNLVFGQVYVSSFSWNENNLWHDVGGAISDHFEDQEGTTMKNAHSLGDSAHQSDFHFIQTDTAYGDFTYFTQREYFERNDEDITSVLDKKYSKLKVVSLYLKYKDIFTEYPSVSHALFDDRTNLMTGGTLYDIKVLNIDLLKKYLVISRPPQLIPRPQLPHGTVWSSGEPPSYSSPLPSASVTRGGRIRNLISQYFSIDFSLSATVSDPKRSTFYFNFISKELNDTVVIKIYQVYPHTHSVSYLTENIKGKPCLGFTIRDIPVGQRINLMIQVGGTLYDDVDDVKSEQSTDCDSKNGGGKWWSRIVSYGADSLTFDDKVHPAVLTDFELIDDAATFATGGTGSGGIGCETILLH